MVGVLDHPAARPLHPAARRRMAPKLPDGGTHTILLRPIGSQGVNALVPESGLANLIHTSRKAKWVEGLLADLAAADWQTRLAQLRRERRTNGATGMLELHLPIHKRYQIALFEAVCVAPGFPRLDPRSITGSGMVMRRLAPAGTSEPPTQAWMRRDGGVRGWQRADERPAYDPDPQQRRNGHKANAAIRAVIAAQNPGPAADAEEIIPLYVAPDSVCAARGKTILYGLIPVASTEAPDDPPPAINYGALTGSDRTEMMAHFSIYLKERSARAMPRAGEALNPDWKVLAPESPDEDLRQFGLFIQQLSSELNVFSGLPGVARLKQALTAIRMPTARNSSGGVTATVSAFDFLRQASDILLLGDRSQSATMPLEWPAVSAAGQAELCAAALDCLTQSYATAVAPTPKFARRNAHYRIKAFVRVRGGCDCADRIQWSGYSEKFRILEWWEGDGPGARIALPDMSQLKKIKPNVSFDVPPSIAAVLGANMKNLAKGEPGGEGPAIAWLCSFSIPIITLCAFIVLHIFLALLDFIFRWMLWIKVCVPIPASKREE